jgi:putative ABC transport system permease protein
VAGAQKNELLFQFLSETVLVAFIALLFAMVIAYLALPLFNQLSGRNINIDFSTNYPLLGLLAVLVVGVGLIAGLYPAVVLAGFKPIEVLKGKLIKSGKGIPFPKSITDGPVHCFYSAYCKYDYCKPATALFADKKPGFQ